MWSSGEKVVFLKFLGSWLEKWAADGRGGERVREAGAKNVLDGRGYPFSSHEALVFSEDDQFGQRDDGVVCLNCGEVCSAFRELY